jgi:5-methyltetrahydropteroyltriglutamate--homocysteine methyltransferase
MTVLQSSSRILTTHVGSLPRPAQLYLDLKVRESGQPHDAAALAANVRKSVFDVVAKQAAAGVDIANDGEHSKSSFAAYTAARLGGFSPVEDRPGHKMNTRDRLAFPDVYEDHRAMCAARPHIQALPRGRQAFACTGPVRYKGQADVRADCANLKEALAKNGIKEGFITALSPNNVSLYYANHFYKTDDEYQIALADAMREEYKAIVAAGFVLQIDDPRLATHYDRHPEISIEECRKFIAAQVELVNYALQGLPADRIRFHTCYSTNVAPRVHDLELKHYVDLMLQINAGGYSFEASNPRHEHEWAVWREVALPKDKVLIPGVVSHCISLVEHPELVSQRICRFADVVGRERVIASNDCGFATSGAGDEVHPQVAWAKLAALTQGAKLASQTLWGSRAA